MAARSVVVGLLICTLLLVGIGAVYAPQWPAWLGGQPALQADDDLTYISDLDFWQRTPRERAVLATTHFDLAHALTQVPLLVGDWTGVDVPETNEEVMILLDPEQYVQRLYTDSEGREIWLTMIGGRSSQPFHAPDICYDADGWQYDLGSHPTRLAEGGEVYGLWLDATKPMEGYAEPAEHVVYYFYLFPDYGRDQADGIVLFKLTSGRYGSLEETLALHEEFTRQFFLAAAAPTEVASAVQ